MSFIHFPLIYIHIKASVGDLVVGLYMCMHLLLPLLGNKSNNNPQSRDLILQLIERFETVYIMLKITSYSLVFFFLIDFSFMDEHQDHWFSQSSSNSSE